jgi:hypothetical protein
MRISPFLCVAFIAGCTSSSNAPLSPSQSSVQSVTAKTSSAVLFIANARSVTFDLAWNVPHIPRGVILTQLPTLDSLGECAHGSTLVATQTDGEIYVFRFPYILTHETLRDARKPMGCAVDPVNGDLAVSNYGDASIGIYRPQGKGFAKLPKLYADAAMSHFEFCGYDPKGNLFVDGVDRNGRFALAEFTSANQWGTIRLNRTIVAPGGVQWDGQHLAIGDAGIAPSVILQFSIAGHTGTKVGATVLNRTVSVKQFYIDRDRVIGPDEKGNSVGVWAYPQGGPPKEFWPGPYWDRPVNAVVVR